MKNAVYRKKINDRPKGDFYTTPYVLTTELVNLNILDKSKLIYDPCCGQGAIGKILTENGYKVRSDDISTTGKDFLENQDNYDCIVMNPPFSLFDSFIQKAKESSPLVVALFNAVYFSAYQRYRAGVWNNLKSVYIFSRKISYGPDPSITKAACMTTAWGVWDRDWDKDYYKTRVLDIQKYF